jgi:hypothetical protein
MLSRDLLWDMPLRRASLGLLSNLTRGTAFAISMESRTFYRRRCVLSIRRLLLALIWNRCPSASTHHSALTKLVACRISFAQAICHDHASAYSFSDNSLLSDALSQFQSHSHAYSYFVTQQQGSQLRSTKMTLSPLRNILLMKRSLLTPRPPALLFSVHISLTFSSTILQWRSKALTRASSLRLLRHEIRTCVCVRVAVWRMDRGPVDSSCASSTPISYSL